MKRKNHYVNGMVEVPGQMREARQLLATDPRGQRLGNFGPFFPNKLERCYRHIETFTLGGYEYTIIESEAMSFSFSTMGVSEPTLQREAWFQPINN